MQQEPAKRSNVKLSMSKNALTVLRAILKELKASCTTKLGEDPASRFIISQYRTYQVTPDKVCRNSKGALHQANAYLCYLKSNRLHQELLDSYKGQGERSIAESANLVGLKLPKEYEDEP